MEVRVAQHTGYCWGVDLAMEMVDDALANRKPPVHSLGPIIHNHRTVESLGQKGLHVAESLATVESGTVIIRSHGVPPEVAREAQERGLAGRPYSEKITQVMSALSALPVEAGVLHPLLRRRPVTKISIVHITPDRGLAGGLVSSINHKTASFILERGVPTDIIAVGRKGLDFLRRTGQNVVAEFIGLGDRPSLIDTLPISHIIIDDFMKRSTEDRNNPDILLFLKKIVEIHRLKF